MLAHQLIAALALLATLAVAPTLHAKKVYRWVDENGKVFYSDKVPPEAKNHARDEINSQGLVVDSIERALTEEERAIARKLEEERRTIAEQEAEKARRERLLLNTFPDEQALLRQHNSFIETQKSTISLLAASAESQERHLAELLREAAGQETEGKAVSREQREAILSARAKVQEIEARIQEARGRILAQETARDAELEQYRRLRKEQLDGR